MKTFVAAITEWGTVVTSAKVALVVGSILVLINYGDRIFLRYDMAPLDWVKLTLTYCVPFCVSMYSAARYAIRHARDREEAANKEPP